MSNTTIVEFERAGMAAFVRAGERKQWFFGQLGAANIAGARQHRDSKLPGEAGLALHARLLDLLERNRDWYAPLEAADPASCWRESILDLLRQHAGCLRTSGHSTIYITTALDALSRQPELATDRVIEALRSLHASGREDDPARYYGVPDYFESTEKAPSEVAPGERSATEAFRMAIASLDHLVADREIDGRYYFLTGEKIHLLTHAHAMGTLEELGHPDLAEIASSAQRNLASLVAVSRTLAQPPIEPARYSPFDAEFWEQDVQDPAHVIKVAEAVVAQVPRLPEAEREVALERMRRVWSLLGIR
jgi:hypothetical protein